MVITVKGVMVITKAVVVVISNVVVSVVDTDVEVKVVSAADDVKTVINSFLTLRIDLIYYI